jgi:lactate dehydrogenase-like 2-hydroxyacid dehydrogenase
MLAGEFDLHALWAEANPKEYLANHGTEFIGLVTSGGVGADKALIAALPSLQVIASRGVGYDKIDLDAARTHGVVVSNTPDVLTDCVADLALGAMISISRKICLADRFVRHGQWLNGKFPLTTRFSGKKLGVVGLGRIGKAIAKRAEGFAMHIRYHARKRVDGSEYDYENSLVRLTEWADFLVICTPGGDQTRHLISKDVLGALGENGFLVNISRGSVVDEEALVSALQNHAIAGAALDVFAKEPQVPAALFDLDNVLLLPHIASSTRETFAAMEGLVLENLRSFFKDGRLLTPVS